MKIIAFIILAFLTLALSGQTEDKGIGVAFLVESLPTKNNPHADTMKIYQDRLQNNLIANFVFNPLDRFQQKIISKTNIIANAYFEFDYETFGLPISRIDSTNLFLEVIFGYANKQPVKGWINMQDKRYSHYLWRENLLDHYLLLTSDAEKMLYDKPNGSLINFKIEKSLDDKLDYILKPIKREKDWMLVKIVTPSDYCKEPTKKREINCWIRYISKTGRPLVWYSPRGC